VRAWLCVLLAASAAGCSASAGLPPADGARALELVRRQVDFGPRVPGTAAHDSCGAWIAARLRAAGARRVREQSFADSVPGWGAVRLTNLAASFGPDRPEGGARGGALLLAAHWDSRPWCDRDPDPGMRGRPLPGANDGGSGVAVLLLLAEAFGRRPPARRVDLLFLDGEDLGTLAHLDGFFRGARHLAADPPRARAELGLSPEYHLGVLLDMVGGRGASFPREPNSVLRAPAAVAEVWETARRLHEGAFVDDVGPSVQDDHLALNDAGIPTVDVIDLSYPEWHTSRDTPAALDPAGMAACFRVLAELAYRR